MPSRPVSGMIHKPAPRPRAIITDTTTMAPRQSSTRAIDQKQRLRSERAYQVLLFLEEEARQDQAQKEGKGKAKVIKKTIPNNAHLQPQSAREYILGLDPGLKWIQQAAQHVQQQGEEEEEKKKKPTTWPEAWRLDDLAAFRRWGSRYLPDWIKEGWPLAALKAPQPLEAMTKGDEEEVDIGPQSPARPMELRLSDEEEEEDDSEVVSRKGPQKGSQDGDNNNDNNGNDGHAHFHHRELPPDRVQYQAPLELCSGVADSTLSSAAGEGGGGGGGGGGAAGQASSSSGILDDVPVPVPVHIQHAAPSTKVDDPSPPHLTTLEGSNSGHCPGSSPSWAASSKQQQKHVTDTVADRYPLPFSMDLLSQATVLKHQQRQQQQQQKQQHGKGKGGRVPSKGAAGETCRGKPFGVDRDEDESWYRWWAARYNKARRDKME